MKIETIKITEEKSALTIVFSPGCVFHKIIEFCPIAFKKGKKPKINKEFVKNKNNIFDLEFTNFLEHLETWYAHRDNTQEYLHPTQKPIKLAEFSIKALSEVNDIVIDFFGGTGSTLLACERLNRTCYMMEIDPIYCSVIIERWEAFTGKKSKKIS